ncbi:MAG: T9SS type A sorting domain-containing protein, partial [Ignavibacteriae bacterium]|nr:T9SS type A sorting domain-containing protein [Ignavibacteriota bacterium]
SSSCVMRLYINGVQWGYLSTSGTITPTSSPLVFGRKAAGSNYYDMFCGIIDEVRIWNYCKTVSQINEQKDIPLFGTEPGLIGYWNFDEGTGTTAYDLTLHNNASIYGPTYLYNINILRFLKYPAQNQYIQNNLTTFSWGNSKDAGIGFQKFQLFIDGNLNKDNFTDSVYTVIAPLSYGAHTWFVKGFDLLGNNQSSETRTYYVDNALPYPFNLISPTDSQIVNIPTPNFSWQGTTDSAGGSGLRKYQLIINYIVSVDSIPVNTTTSSPGNALPQGSYTFYVKAYDNVANIRQSTQTRTFYVDWEPPTPFTLISPSNGDTSVTKRPVFTWHKSTDIGSGLVKYELIISGQPIITLPGADSSKQITFDLPNGNYTWYVKAYDRAGSFRSSNVNSLTVNVLPVPVAPLLSQPINNSVNQPTDLIFKWGIPNEYLKFSYDFSSNKSALTVLKYWYEVTTDTISFTNLMRDTILTDTLKNVTGLSNLTTFYWRVKAKNQYSYGPFSIWYKFTTTGLSSISLNSNWNIFSMPLQAQNMSVISLIPGASSSAFAYNSGYQQVTTLQNGKGYWIKYDSARTFIVTGIAVNPRICAVNEGWNIIGPFESEVAVSAITSNPPGIIVSQFFGFNNGYSNATTLTSGKGYWIKTTQSGTLILPQSTDISLQVENKPEVNENWMSIEITDSKQNKAKLYLGEKENVFGVYELPPVGPSGVFDVRFASDNFVDIWSGSHTVKISSPEYPVKIKIENIKGKLLRIKDNISGKILNQAVTEKTVITVNSPLSAFSIIADNMIPTTYDLSQNYPNPFNPVTTIKYQIPKDGLVKLIIYDVLGREIKILVNEIKTAGYYDIKFDASYLSSGIYFYRFYTGNYTSIKKMMVIK